MNRQIVLYVLLFAVLLSWNPCYAKAWEVREPTQSDTTSVVSVQGRIRDAATRKPLGFVSVHVDGTNISSVSNFDGNFVIKIPKSMEKVDLMFSHLGYKNVTIPVIPAQQRNPVNVEMETASYSLKEVVLRPLNNPTEIVLSAIRRISDNYGRTATSMVGFYREFVKKNNSYVSVAEAVLDIHKAPYHTFQRDIARIYKGRKSGDINRSDTVIFKYQGGILSTLMLDVAKNVEILFTESPEKNYDFTFEGLEVVNEKPHYKILFNQKEWINDILFRGVIYIESYSLAIARIEFNMNVEDNPSAASLFVKRSPRGAQFAPLYASYVIHFREQNGRWFYSYGRSEVKLKSNWRQFIFFKPTCTVTSEMAITDIDEQNIIPAIKKEAVKANDIVAEKLSVFTGDQFWGSYNYIEPEQSIESAINRMNRRLKREGMLLDLEQEE